MATNDSAAAMLVLKAHVSAVNLLVVLPLSVFILFLGFQQWRSKRKDPSWSTSFSDFFTFHQALMEVVGNAGSGVTVLLVCLGSGDSDRSFAFGSFAWYGQMAFPLFTCLEHYVAVVRPVTYVGLKTGKGPVIRNASAAAVWLVAVALITAVLIVGDYVLTFLIIDICLMTGCLAAVSHCSVAVLRVLVLPKPGGAAVRDRVKVDRSKRYALFVIGLVLVVLSLRFGWNVALSIIWTFPNLRRDHEVLFSFITCWINLVTSLMQPLLYLHKTGRLRQRGRAAAGK